MDENYSTGVCVNAPIFVTSTTAVTSFSEFLVVEKDQSWYWTKIWQKMEKKADEDIEKKDYEIFNSMDDFIRSL